MHILFIFAIAQFLFLAVLLLAKRRLPGIRFLALLLIDYAAGIFVGYLYATQAVFEYPIFARMGFPLIALMGPLIHLALRDVTEEESNFRWWHAWIFIVPVAEIIYLIPFFFQSTDLKIIYLTEDLKSLHFDCLVLLYASLFNNAATAGLAWWRLYRRGKAELGQTFKITHYLILLLTVLFLTLSLVDKNLLNSGIFAAFMALAALALSYFILFGLVDLQMLKSIATSSAKYEKSALGEPELAQIAAKIDSAYNRDQVFLDFELSLGKLARHVGETNAALSQVFSRFYQKTFYEYTTAHRLSAFERLAREKINDTILSLAFEAGFSSKATFNAAFKKKHGVSPKSFRDGNAGKTS